MTIREIAQVANVNRTTVQRWIKKVGAERAEIDAKCIAAVSSKIEADFTLEQTLAIVRAGGNETLADLLAENAKATKATSDVTKVTRSTLTPRDRRELPSAEQMKVLERLVGQKTAGDVVLYTIGFSRNEKRTALQQHPEQPLLIEERPVLREEAGQYFNRIRDNLPGGPI